MGFNNIIECKTLKVKESPRKGMPCIFPFEYEGKKYEKCTKVQSEKFWCATDVDEDGKYIDGSKSWGYCENNCLKRGLCIVHYHSKIF